MMSDLPGEITKQILSAPPRIIRSTRYSLTAQGRSTPPSRRLPTGRSSFEKARGWMRLPRPAAGTIPHMSGLHHGAGPGWRIRRSQKCLELLGTAVRGVLFERARAACLGDPAQLGVREVEGRDGVRRGAGEQDLPSGLEEGVKPLPGVG